MTYKIVSSSDPKKVESQVSELLKGGWELHGSLVVISHKEASHERGNIIYTQALTTTTRTSRY